MRGCPRAGSWLDLCCHGNLLQLMADPTRGGNTGAPVPGLWGRRSGSVHGGQYPDRVVVELQLRQARARIRLICSDGSWPAEQPWIVGAGGGTLLIAGGPHQVAESRHDRASHPGHRGSVPILPPLRPSADREVLTPPGHANGQGRAVCDCAPLATGVFAPAGVRRRPLLRQGRTAAREWEPP